MNQHRFRNLLVWWLYGSTFAHFMVGALLPLLANQPLLEAYHRSVEAGFWQHAAPQAARAQQIWWISLFGATVQCLALWMGALIYCGHRYRSSVAWGWLIIGLVLWAPQDMLISLQNDMQSHVWIDSAALLAMLPPLIWLWQNDRHNKQSIPQNTANTGETVPKVKQ